MHDQSRYLSQAARPDPQPAAPLSSEFAHRRMGFVPQPDSSGPKPRRGLSARIGAVLRLAFVSAVAGTRARPRPRRLTVLGVTICNSTVEETVQWMLARAAAQVPTLVTFVNAHCLNVARRDPDYREALSRSTRVLADGSGVRLACRFQGLDLADNLNGTDLFAHVCAAARADGRSLYLLGAAPGVAERMAARLGQRFPGLRIAGTRDGYFGVDETDDVLDAVNRSGADLLFVAMGVPLQERWLAAHRDRLKPPIAVAVGGLFDFYAETIRRAPLGLRECGLEWCWRLAMEPARMWRRYLFGNPLFVARAWIDARRGAASLLPQSRRAAALRRFGWRASVAAGAAGKRALDVVGAGLALTLAAPLMALTALAIRIESPGPAFYSQIRMGTRGVPFQFWKFRSMYVDAEQRRAALEAANEMHGGVLFKMRRDPRITRVGRVIRRYSIDELPQLWNVLRGDMSLVGPRPALPNEVAQYSLDERHRLLAKPGITCTWQVSGRSDVPFERQVAMDVEYFQEAGLARDVELLLKTVPAVLSGRGAY